MVVFPIIGWKGLLGRGRDSRLVITVPGMECRLNVRPSLRRLRFVLYPTAVYVHRTILLGKALESVTRALYRHCDRRHSHQGVWR